MSAIHREEAPGSPGTVSITTLTAMTNKGILRGDSPPPRLSHGEAHAKTANQSEGFVRLAEQTGNRLCNHSSDYVSCYLTLRINSDDGAFISTPPQQSKLLPHRARASARWRRHAHHQEEPETPAQVSIASGRCSYDLPDLLLHPRAARTPRGP